MSEEIAALRADVARLTEAVDYLVRRQRALDELKEDLTPVATEAFQVLTVELARMDEDFSLDDLVELGRKLVRNTRNLSRALDQLDSVMDLVGDVGPLSTEVFHVAVSKLDQLERDGHMDMLRTLSSPEMMDLAKGSLDVLADDHPPLGPFALFNAMRDPEVQAGMGLMMALLRHLGRSAKQLPVPTH